MHLTSLRHPPFGPQVLDEEEVGVIEDQKASLITNTCIPVLREALMDMFRGVERFHMDTAAGTNLEVRSGGLFAAHIAVERLFFHA